MPNRTTERNFGVKPKSFVPHTKARNSLMSQKSKIGSIRNYNDIYKLSERELFTFKYLTFLYECVRRQFIQSTFNDGAKVILFSKSSSYLSSFFIIPFTLQKRKEASSEPVKTDLFVIVNDGIDEIHHGFSYLENMFHLVHP